ncbi:MAG: M28 family peptidase [Euryarchaeota archaeon]|nr:M28 family peptidase [Euryarchaeota archaeon]
MRVPLPLVALTLLVPLLAGCTSTSDDPLSKADEALPFVVPEIPVLDGKALVAHVSTFVEAYPKRNANGEAHKGARDYLEKSMQEAGLEVLRQPYEATPSRTSTPTNQVEQDPHLENIMGIKWGRDRSSWIVIGGHYDVTDGAVYGAYDDGSGTIMTLEMAKAYAELDTLHTIAFMMFDGEEQGLTGSRHFVKMLTEGTFNESLTGKADETVDYTPTIFAMINLDMFGINWPAEAPIYLDDNSDRVRAIVDDTRRAIEIPPEKFRYQGITLGRSDYAPFEDRCIPIAFFISSFEENYVGPAALPAGVSYPFWHQADTVEGMETMAGSRDLLEQGFTVAARLAGELLHKLATTEGLDLEVRRQGLDCEADL